jgi:hypothetical protein
VKHLIRALTAAVLAALLSWSAPAVRAAEPIKIGFSMELTGPFAVVGKTGLQRAAEAFERGRLEMRLAPSQLVSLRTCSKLEASRSSCSANTTRIRSTPPEPEVGTLAACLASAALLRSSCARATL